MSQRNLRSTFRLMALSSSGLKEARNALGSAAASLSKLSSVATESNPWIFAFVKSSSPKTEVMVYEEADF